MALTTSTFTVTRHSQPAQPFDEPATQLIAQLPPHCGPSQCKLVEDKIKAEAYLAGEVCRQTEQAYYERNQARYSSAEARSQAVKHWSDVAEQQLSAIKRGSILLAVCFLACLVICQVAEYTLSLTLAYILGIPPHSFSGTFLALITVTAVTSLEIVIGTLIYRRWQTLKAHESRAAQIAGWVLISVFLVNVGWLDIYTVSVIAPAREEVVKQKDNLLLPPAEVPQPVDLEKIHRAIFWVSICAAVNSALFFLLFIEALSTPFWRTLVRVKWLRHRHRRWQKKHSQATAELNLAKARWDTIEERVEAVVTNYETPLLLKLEQALQRQPAARPYLVRVNDILDSRAG